MRSKSSINSTSTITSPIWWAAACATCSSDARPKDFDIGTSAHPHQVKKLFRNCWIIGRRFRLAHVKFGTKTIEVATFRRLVEPQRADARDRGGGASRRRSSLADGASDSPNGNHAALHAERSRLIHRDNTYGTPEEDAFRRDFTVNALFYDIGTFAIIDYVGGLEDLDRRLIRCIGDPSVRFIEDPVRMLRAVVLAARLQFTIDEPILDAIKVHRHEIARSAPARLMEEFYKILRSGHAEEAMRQLRATGLMKEITSELAAAPEALWRSIAALDRYRNRFASAPESLTNAILAGTLLHPMGLIRRQRFSADPLERKVELGMLPIARRDVERLQQIVAIQPSCSTSRRRCARSEASCTARSSTKRSPGWRSTAIAQTLVAHWRELKAQAASQPPRLEPQPNTSSGRALQTPPATPPPRQLRREVLRPARSRGCSLSPRTRQESGDH